jgi:dTDP-4-dehydrorhamnose 3,5-epimerase
LRFTQLPISGAFVIDADPAEDERGFFARLIDAEEFARRGLATFFPQVSMSYSRATGTVRGLHYQVEPAPEAKLVRCTRGAMHDVIVDLRPDSPTHLQHVAVELTANNRRAVYIPRLCAHGFQTLDEHTETLYHIDNVYTPTAARGLRYDDPELGIAWPRPVSAMSEKDRSWPLLTRSAEELHPSPHRS